MKQPFCERFHCDCDLLLILEKNCPLKVSTTTKLPKEILEKVHFRGPSQIFNKSQTTFLPLASRFLGSNQQTSHLFLHISWSLLMSLDFNSFEEKEIKKRTSGNMLTHQNCELCFRYHIYVYNIFSPPAKPYTQAARFVFSVGAVTGGHAGRLSWFLGPAQHWWVAPVRLFTAWQGWGGWIPGKCEMWSYTWENAIPYLEITHEG